jgi:GT2 family glycosyltransferase
MKRKAVLMTCFNRRDSTINCLKHLYILSEDVVVYLVDDNSTDGTSNAVTAQFPQTIVIKGNGNLYWNRGMHLAWEKASKIDYDFYLWLNDDVILYENCLNELFECANKRNNDAIISGIIESPDGNDTLYGGTNEYRELITPNGKLNQISRMNGNVVLIPKAVYKKLGNLDRTFHHDLGDVDYGLRAKSKGIGVFTTRTAVASGSINNMCRVRLPNTSVANRFRKLYSPLGSNPFIDFYFRKRHNNLINASLNFIFLHIINIGSDRIIKKVFGNKYF